MLKKVQCIVVCSLLAAGLNGCSPKKEEPKKEEPKVIKVSFGTAGSAIEKLIVSETKVYFGKRFTNQLAISENGQEACVVFGTPQSNSLIKKAVDSGVITLPEGKNADQGYTIKTVNGAIYVAGRSGEGVLYGLYTLLERYGVYFQISGERLPAQTAFAVKQIDVRVSPVFKYRGLLPWDNFLCGMSAWNIEHYREFIDRAARMKFNMLQFHFYPGLAFFTETWNGKPVDPTFLGSPDDVFRTKGAVGEKTFGGMKIFGSKPYVDNIGNPRKQADACQAMMREVIDYAHNRAFKTCVGFELMNSNGGKFTSTDKPQEGNGGANLINPLGSKNVDLSVERYRSLVATYPNSDFYWMWQPEARGYLSRNVGKEPGAAEMRKKYAHWAQKDNEGDIDYAYLFREVANRLTPRERSRLATGGWFIEHIFPRIDADFPKEITFAALNESNPQAGQKTISSYRAARSGRKAWLIEWWEFDGLQWFPQFRVDWQEEMYQECAAYGVEGVSLLGWKLSGIEHNIRFLADFSWNPKLTAKQFYADYVCRAYGPAARSIAGVYETFDKYEPITPTSVPGIPAKRYFSNGWSHMATPLLPNQLKGLDEKDWKNMVDSVPAHIRELQGDQQMCGQAIAEFKTVMPKLDADGQSFAKLMVNRLETRIYYVDMLISLDESMAAFDAVARKDGLKKGRDAASVHAQRARESIRKSVEKYSEEIRNRGDQGVVAQMNEQFYKMVKGYASSLDADKTAYAEIDLTTFRLTPAVRFDFSGQPPWGYRDGKVKFSADKVNGKPTLKLEMGDANTRTHSAVIYGGRIDLDKSPFVDFKIRTTSHDSLAIMFQTGDGQWRALNLIGWQTGYAGVDALREGAINDGKWHRVTWNLRRLLKEELGSQDYAVTSVIIGSWEKLSAPIVIEFQDFAFGQQNTLD